MVFSAGGRADAMVSSERYALTKARVCGNCPYTYGSKCSDRRTRFSTRAQRVECAYT
jgi:hypothetical protein